MTPTLDNKLTLNEHIKTCHQEQRSLTRLSGSTWGSNMEVLNKTSKTYIKSILKYYTEITETIRYALKSCQNKWLHTVTDAKLQNSASCNKQLPYWWWSQSTPCSYTRNWQVTISDTCGSIKLQIKVDQKNNKTSKMKIIN